MRLSAFFCMVLCLSFWASISVFADGVYRPAHHAFSHEVHNGSFGFLVYPGALSACEDACVSWWTDRIIFFYVRPFTHSIAGSPTSRNWAHKSLHGVHWCEHVSGHGEAHHSCDDVDKHFVFGGTTSWGACILVGMPLM
jgi:hypothetical protein